MSNLFSVGDVVRSTVVDSIVGLGLGETGKVVHVSETQATVLWDTPSANGNPRYTSAFFSQLQPVGKGDGADEQERRGRINWDDHQLEDTIDEPESLRELNLRYPLVAGPACLTDFEIAVNETLRLRTAFLNEKDPARAEVLSVEMRVAAAKALKLYTERANAAADRLGVKRPPRMSLERFLRTVVISRRVS